MESLGKHIVILQRGWVVVGDLFKTESKYHINNGSVIRLWGTSEGLGQLAISGPLSGTRLDKVTDGTWFHELTIVGAMPCSNKWD